MTGRWVSPIGHDRTCLVEEIHFWNLTRNDQTLEAERPISCSGTSGQQMTVEIRRLLLNVV